MGLRAALRCVRRLHPGAADGLQPCGRPGGEPQGTSVARLLGDTGPPYWGPSSACVPSGRDDLRARVPCQRLDSVRGDARGQRTVVAIQTSGGAERARRVRPLSIPSRLWEAASAPGSPDAHHGFGVPHRACLPWWVCLVPWPPAPCTRLSRAPWTGVTPSPTTGTPSPEGSHPVGDLAFRSALHVARTTSASHSSPCSDAFSLASQATAHVPTIAAQ